MDILLKCVKNGSTVSNFTDGKIYHSIGIEGNGVLIYDDFNYMKFIIPGERSPHLVKEKLDSLYKYGQECVGWFEVVNGK